MKKPKRWVASEDHDSLVSEVAFLRKQHDAMVECINQLVLTGNDMYDLAVQDSSGIGTSRQFQKWKKLSERYD